MNKVDTTQFLTERRNAGVTPDVVTRELIANGWSADNAAAAALRSLRRTDHHGLLYWTLTFSAGFAALATASALHLAMIPETQRSALSLAIWITIALVALPLALVSGHFAKQVEARSAYATWSPTRRALFGTLAGVTAVIGVGRLLTYVFEAVAALVGVAGYELTPASLPQVIVSVAVSVPLFAWALIEWRRSNVLIRGLGDEAGDQDASKSGDRRFGSSGTQGTQHNRGMLHDAF